MSDLVCTLWPTEGPRPVAGAEAVLDSGESRHLVRVRRLRVGEEVWASVGDGRGVRCTLIGGDRARARLRAEEVISGWREPRLRVDLALGLVRSQYMESALTEGTALGLHRFHPLLTERVEREKVRPDRLERLVREAVKQCGRGWMPPVGPPRTLDELLEASQGAQALLVADQTAPDPLPVLRGRGEVPEEGEVLLVVGPEGDLSPSERSRLDRAGAIPFHLGPRRLRSETAARTALSLLLAG